MRFRFFLFFLSPFLLFSEPSEWPNEPPQSEEEALFLRRIADFWQEGEYKIAKIQMEEFLDEFPNSAYFDPLCVALGDLLLREKNYSEALSFYKLPNHPEFFNRVFINRMQCLYHMQWYATLADECESFLEKQNLDEQQKLHSTYFLAIALYQQCLNAVKEPETLLQIAGRAQPYFEELFESPLSAEVAQAFAHLCCIRKDFPKASQIYLQIGQSDPSISEEMTFQAALIQAEFDKKLAIQTFGKVAELGEKRAQEASYNRLILSHDLGLHEEVVREKEAWLLKVPPEKEAMAHLFLGRSCLSLKKYSEATAELRAYIENAPSSETLHAALISLLEASFQSNDLTSLDLALSKLMDHYPQDPELPKAYLSRVQILKKEENLSQARTDLVQLLEKFPEFPQKAQALFELAHLDYQMKSWHSCQRSASSFLLQFPEHELTLFALRYLISSLTEISALAPEKTEPKQELIAHLEELLAQSSFLSPTEKSDFQFLLASTYFELGDYPSAITALESLSDAPLSKTKEANALLLLAFCYRDGMNDKARFCELAEMALEKKADLVGSGQIHTCLFNAYLEMAETDPERIENSAHHLYAAFVAGMEIQPENLLWLADIYYNQLREDIENDMTPSLPLVKRTASILEKLAKNPPTSTEEGERFMEYPLYKLGRLYSVLGQLNEEISLLENLSAKYAALPSIEWAWEKETLLLLGEAYLRKGLEEKASLLFDSILKLSVSLRNKTSAAACLQAARLQFNKCIKEELKFNHPDSIFVFSELKNLVLQRSLPNEPIYLEAALDYVDFQSKLDGSCEKRLNLLSKTKADFEQTQDLLSKDYHESRAKWPRKNQIYEGYMKFIDAEIFLSQANLAKDPLLQKELQVKAKDLLQEIIHEPPHPALMGRARQQLGMIKNIDET